MEKELARSIEKNIRASELASRMEQHLKTNNRSFLPKDISDAVGLAINEAGQSQSNTDMMGQKMWRARKHINGEKAFSEGEMGAPPHHLSLNGRISPAGISCLYLADSVDTAIAETRPWKGVALSVAQFRLTRKLRLADFRKRQINKGVLVDGKDLSDEFRALVYIGAFAFYTPAQDGSAIDFAPSQYVSSRLRHEGYDGILYTSMMHKDGFNVALFCHTDAEIVVGSVKRYRVDSVQIKSRTVNN